VWLGGLEGDGAAVSHATKREGARLEWAPDFAESEKPAGQFALPCGVMSKHRRL
jgi:hypothetical protein